MIYFLIRCILLIIGSLALDRACYSQKPKYDRIIFSDTRYPEYQKQLALLIDPEEQELKAGDIGIALIDLNDDGIKEIIGFVLYGRFYTSVTGNSTVIYQQYQGKLLPLWKDSATEGRLAILKHKTGQYHDIVSIAEDFPSGEGKFSKHCLAWDAQKNSYVYIQSEAVTDEEKELFINAKNIQ